MKLSDLKHMMEQDSVIDHANLDREALKIPYLHGRWYGFFIDESRLYRSLMNEYRQLKRFKMEYYLGKCPDDVYEREPLNLKILKQDLDIYMESDAELNALEEKMNTQKLKVEMIESFVKSLNNRGYNIKCAVDFIKFKNGL